MSSSQATHDRARRLIPGGTQLLSKRPELFCPGQWPAHARRARGVEIEDLDGRVFTDVGIHAVGACPLGYADPDVDEAVVAAIRAGSTSSLNPPEEVELAELLCALHPWADMVRYTRGGGEAMAVAVRIARAATGRDVVALSGYHGWHDWYLAANLEDETALDALLFPGVGAAGVPRGLAGTALPFALGAHGELDRIVERHGSELAAVVVEPARYAMPAPGDLEHARAAASRAGAVLILDEITTGFRLAVGGAHLEAGVHPDLAVFAKGMSNGYPMGTVLGRREVMEAAARTFVSSTSWSERTGPAAALATIRKLQRHDVPAHLAAAGDRMREGWERLAGEHGLAIDVRGVPPLPRFSFRHEDARAVATLYTQCMLDQGFLASEAFYPSLAHSAAVVDAALAATGRAFATIAAALARGGVRSALRGPVARRGLSRGEADSGDA